MTMDNEMEEFNEDFVPRSYAARENIKPCTDAAVVDARIRRMSLKEFSGLENPRDPCTSLNTAQCTSRNSFGSPLFLRLQNVPAGVGSLFEKFSNRRRSSTALNRVNATPNDPIFQSSAKPLSGSNPVLDPLRRVTAVAADKVSSTACDESFEKVMEDINLALDETREDLSVGSSASADSNSLRNGETQSCMGEKLDFENAHERLAQLKHHVKDALSSVPPENSPIKKLENTNKEKLIILNESRHVVSACKIMVRTVSPSSSTNEFDLARLVSKALSSMEKIVQSASEIIRKSSTCQAQLLSMKLDQVLTALVETIHHMQASMNTQKYGEEAKALIRTSTTLASNLTQWIQSVQRL